MSSVQVTIVVQIRAHFLFGNLIALLLSLTLFLLSFCDYKEKKVLCQKDRLASRQVFMYVYIYISVIESKKTAWIVSF